MPNFQHTFTGRDTGVEIKPLDRLSRSQERMDDFLVKAEEMKYKTFKENKDWFLKQSNTDVHKYLWEGHAKAQVNLMDKFTNDVTAIVKDAGGFGNLTGEQQLKIAKARKEVDMAQAKMLADEERLKLDEKIVQSKPDYYSVEKFQERVKDAIDTGTYSEDPLPIRSLDPANYLKAEGQKITSEFAPDVVLNAKGDMKATRTVNFDPQDAKSLDNWIAGKLMGDPRVVQGLMEDFDANATPEEKIKYLDTDGDGSISDDEKAAIKTQSLKWGNPVLTWALNNPKYRNAAINPKVSNWTSIPQGSGNKSFDWNVNIGSGHNRNNEFPVRGTVEIDTDEGKATLPNSLDFSGISRTTTDARKINTVLVPNGRGGYDEKPLGESASFDIVTYSPQDDVLVIRLKGGTSDRTYRDGVNLLVKGSEFDDLLKRKPFGIDRSAFEKPASKSGTLDELGLTTPIVKKK